MANKRWIGKQQAIAQKNTITIAGTWATGDTATLTINTKTLVLTVGTDTTTANVATAIKEMINGDTQTGTGDHTFSETGNNVPEFAELGATVSGSVVTVTADTRGKPFTLTVSESTAGTGTATGAVSVACNGPNYWSSVNNWDAGAVPVSGVNEVQAVTVDATGGTFTVTYEGQTTAATAFNATASTLQTNLEALSTIGAGNVAVTGGPGAAGGGTPYTLTFQNALGYQNLNQVTASGASLTGGAGTATPATTQAGSTGDDVYFDNSSVSVLYDIAQSAVALNSLNIDASYTGTIGLPKTNTDGDPYVEYRTDYLTLGATTINIGRGSGQGSGRIKLNTGTVKTTLNLFSTGNSLENDLQPALWKGTNAYNAVNSRGSSELGIAVFGGETATVSAMDVTGTGSVYGGSGLTLTTLTNAGATITLRNGCTTLTTQAGTVVIEGGAVTTLTATTLENQGAVVTWNSTGTLGTATMIESALDFSRDPRAKTVSQVIEIYGSQARVIDPESTVASLRVDLNQAEANQISWGPNVRLTRSAVS